MSNKNSTKTGLAGNLHYIIFFTLLILGTIFLYPRRENCHIVGPENYLKGNLFVASEVEYLSPFWDNSNKDVKLWGGISSPQITKNAIILKPDLSVYGTRYDVSKINIFLDNDNSEKFTPDNWFYFIFAPSLLLSFLAFAVMNFRKKKNMNNQNEENGISVENRICNICGATYNPAEYDAGAEVWLCSKCKNPLPR